MLELAEKAMDTWTVLHTDFLAPPVVWAASVALENVAGLAVRAWGGFPQARQCSVVSAARCAARTFVALDT